MSGFALYADQAGAWTEDMPRSPKVDPNFGEGFFRGTGQIFMREAFAKPARAASMAGAVVPIAIDAITGGTTLQDKYFDFHKDKFDSAVKFWTPTPGEVGMAAEIVGGLGGVLGQIMLSPHLAVSNQFLSQAEDLITQPGVTSRQALGVGAAQALGLGVGIWAPPALGYNLATKAATGAGVNLAQGIITRGASAAILGDNPAAASFPAFGGQEMLLDTLLGAAFGAASHFMPRWNAEVEAKTDALWQARAQREIRAGAGDVTAFDMAAAAATVNNRFATAISDWAKAATPSDVAALATLRVAKHLNVDSLPGRATSPAAVDVHVAAMREAIQSLLADRPVTARVAHDDGSPIAPQAAETPARDILAQARQELDQGQEGPYYQELAAIAADPADPRRAELIGNLHPEIAAMPERPADPAKAQIWDEIHQPAVERAPGQPSVTDDLVAAVRRWDPESPVFHVKQPSLFEPVPDPTAAPRLAAMREEAARIAREEGLPPPEPDAIDVFVTREVGAAGRPPEEAQAAGAMWKAAFESFGKAAGLDPTQLFYRYMDRVIGYGTDKTPDAATTLMQEATRPANQIERYRPTIKTAKANRLPIFDTEIVAMGHPNVMSSSAISGKRISWLIYDRRGGTATKVGFVIADLDPATNKFLALQNIELDPSVRGSGIGEGVVAMMLAHNGDQTMRVVDITHAGRQGTPEDALPFWKKLGTVLDNYSSDPNVQMDGRITLADYLGARRGQRPAAGRGNDAAQAVPADAQGSRGGADGTGRPRGADTLFQSPTGRWYYSALSAAIDAAPPRAQNAGTWKQWLQAQINAGRIKETEVELSGIREFLDAQEGTIPPDQLRAYMEQVGETNALFQRAGHMSPHTFNAFDHAHIGRGEGFQVYGWGTYLWTNRAVGDWYYTNFERAAQRDASITIREGPLDTKWMGPNSEPTAEAKKLFTEEQLVAMSAFDEELKKDGSIIKAFQRSEGRIRQALDNQGPAGERTVAAGKAIAWLSDLIMRDMAARTIGVNDDPAYKTPDGRMVHASMQGAAKSLADAIAQVESYGYERAAQTFDRLVEQASEHASRTSAEIQHLIDHDRFIIASKGVAYPVTEVGKSGWGDLEPNARNWQVGWIDKNGTQHSEGIVAADTAEEAIARHNEALENFILTMQGMIRQAHERVAELQRTRQLVDDITEPTQPKPIKVVGGPRGEFSYLIPDNQGGMVVQIRQSAPKSTWEYVRLDGGGVPGLARSGFQTKEEALAHAARLSRSLKSGYEKVQPQIKKPRHYTVEAPENDVLVNWSKPLSQQPANILQRLETNGIKVITEEEVKQQAQTAWEIEREGHEQAVDQAKTDEEREAARADMLGQPNPDSPYYRRMAEDFLQEMYASTDGWAFGILETASGRDLYVKMMRQFGYESGPLDRQNTPYAAQASEAFAKMGIPGHRYLDGSSRRRGEGTYNLVIYDDKAMQIVHMEQARERGFLQIGDGRKMLIGLAKDADASTFMHESAHFFLEVMDDLSITVPALKADMEVLFKEWGITRADWDQMDLNGKRPYHEMFAESFEVYLMTNKAPTPALRTVFQRFRDWLLDVYQAATATGRKVSQPMRDLFDRMLDAQRREQATAQAAEPTPGPPPPPQPGESRPPVAVDPFNFEANGEPQPPKPMTLEDQDMRELIREVVEKEAGWYQIGGRNVTGQTGVANFSEWIPNGPWWTGRPDKKMNAQMYINAVAKALVGDKLKPMEQRAVQYLLDHLNERRVEDWRAAKVEWDKLSEDLVAEGIEPTPASIIDLDAVARATAIDEAAVERLALQYGDDDVGFMAEVRRIIDDQSGQTVQGGQEGGAAPAEGTTVPGGAAAAAGDGKPPAQRVAGRAGEAGSPDPLAREADRVAMENPSMLIQFEQPDGQVVRMTAAQYLEQVRMEAELARQDMSLLTTAAECMLGAMT